MLVDVYGGDVQVDRRSIKVGELLNDLLNSCPISSQEPAWGGGEVLPGMLSVCMRARIQE